MLGSQLMMLGIQEFVFGPNRATSEGSLDNMTIFFVASTLQACGSLFFWTQTRGQINLRTQDAVSENQKKAKALVFFILSLALAESVSVMGFVTSLQASSVTIYYCYSLFGVGIILTLAYIPKITLSKSF